MNEHDGYWREDKHAGSWIWIINSTDPTDKDISPPTVIEEVGGFNYYISGSEYPAGFVSIEDVLKEDSSLDEDEAKSVAFETAKDLALEK